ncbi:MAG: cyclic nucleotide-binding domain-containing protein [Myxococcales bacterium]|nr:cyclic nucleotide-binding domain-containing protein [Myxococcales bacterium]
MSLPSHPDVLATLASVDPLRSLDRSALEALASVVTAAEAAPGDVIVREGDADRAMYVLASGHARVVRGGVELGTLSAGEHFGEIALVSGGVRTASVIADAPCVLLVLDEARYQTLVDREPHVAVQLLREIVTSTSSRLAKMNEAVGVLLRERALPRRVELDLVVDGEARRVRNGVSPGELLPRMIGDAPVVAALVDGRARNLDVPLGGGCAIAPLTTAHWEGQRIFRQSLALAFLEAARASDLQVKLGRSLGVAQRVRLVSPGDPGLAGVRLQAELDQLAADDVPLVRERLSVLEAVDYFRREGADETVALLETTRRNSVTVVSYGDVFALETGPLLPSTGHLSRRFYVEPDMPNHGARDLLLVFGVPGHSRTMPPAAPIAERAEVESGRPSIPAARRARDVSKHVGAMTEQQERWLETLSVRSVGDFNRACIGGEVSPIIRVAEGFHEKSIGRIADALAAARDRVRLVTIAGPSSSGKSTFIKRLKVQLQVNGITPRDLGLDDYYVDRVDTPLDEKGEYDFEALHALRLELLQAHLAALVRGEEVRTPRYDFKSGKGDPHGGPTFRLADGDLLMLEGIHGLNPELVEALPAEQVFRIFVCPLVQLPLDRLSWVHASDLRLLRRIVRDRHGRGHGAADTILRWPSVRDGERKHIFPFQDHADEVFDTSLVYEISVLKVFAELYLLEVPSDHPAQATAERLLELLSSWVTIYPDEVPPTSILREFIGGSGFSY